MRVIWHHVEFQPHTCLVYPSYCISGSSDPLCLIAVVLNGEVISVNRNIKCITEAAGDERTRKRVYLHAFNVHPGRRWLLRFTSMGPRVLRSVSTSIRSVQRPPQFREVNRALWAGTADPRTDSPAVVSNVVKFGLPVIP